MVKITDFHQAISLSLSQVSKLLLNAPFLGTVLTAVSLNGFIKASTVYGHRRNVISPG
jgi:hypothetical protein